MNSLLEVASEFVGVIAEVSRYLSTQIERKLRRDENYNDEARPEVLLKCFLFTLHITDRITFAHLSSTDRDFFMSTVLTMLSRTIDEEYLREKYDLTQKKYSSFKELLPKPGSGTKGTLFWEFGKEICYEHKDINVVTISLLAHHAAETFIVLSKVFKESVTS